LSKVSQPGMTHFNDWITLYYKGKTVGQILLDVNFYPDINN